MSSLESDVRDLIAALKKNKAETGVGDTWSDKPVQESLDDIVARGGRTGEGNDGSDGDDELVVVGVSEVSKSDDSSSLDALMGQYVSQVKGLRALSSSEEPQEVKKKDVQENAPHAENPFDDFSLDDLVDELVNVAEMKKKEKMEE
eukprot:PhM_4_TR4859/c0_g1_i1/m.68517